MASWAAKLHKVYELPTSFFKERRSRPLLADSEL